MWQRARYYTTIPTKAAQICMGINFREQRAAKSATRKHLCVRIIHNGAIGAQGAASDAFRTRCQRDDAETAQAQADA